MRFHSSAPLRSRSGLARTFLTAVLLLAAHSHASAESPVKLINAEARAGNVVVTPVRDSISMLSGSGGNIAVLSSTEGKFMVDGGITLSQEPLQAALDRLGPGKPKYLINTHYHGDHTGGNENFAKDGVTVVAHDNVRVRLAAGTIQGLTGNKIAPRPAEALPKQTYFGGSITLEVGGRKAVLTYVANAHTDGDTWVYFPDANVLCTGDTSNNLKKYQNIDFANGGDVRGMIRAQDAYLNAGNDATKIVVGHGPLASKADIRVFREMLVTSHDRIKKLFDEGKSEDEVLAAKPLADLDPTWGNNAGHAAGHTRNVYNSFKRF